MKNTCPHEPRLTACLLGDLPPAEAAAVRAHLDACSACRAAAVELAPLLDTLRDALAADAASPLALEPARLAATLATPPRRRRRVRFYLLSPLIGIAATAVIVLGAALLFPALEHRGVPAGRSASATEVEVCFSTPVLDELHQDKAGAFLAGAAASAPAEEGASLRRRADLRAGEEAADLTHGLGDAPARPPKPQAPKSAVAAPAATAAPGAPPPRKSGVPQSGVAAEDAKGDPFAAVTYDRTVATPRPEAPPRAAQPQAADSVVSAKSPVILKGVVGASRREGTRRQLMRAGKSEASERAARGSETFDADDIPVALLDASGHVTADSPALPADAVGGERTRRPTSPAAEMGRERTHLPAARTAKDLGVVTEPDSRVAGRKDRTEGAGAKIVERDGALGLEALRPPAEPAARPLPPPPPPVFNPFVETAVQPFSTFAIDVDTASYTLARQSLLNGALPEPGHIRTEEIVNAFDYGDRAPDHATFRIFVEGSPAPFGRGTALIRLGVKGRRLGREEARPAVLTFVVDASGSMAQPDRIGLARLALAELLGRLGPDDRIQLIAFNDAARVLADPAAATGGKEVLAAFDRIQCTGSTHLEGGLRLAYDRAAAAFRPGAENRVILLSDGVANLGAGSADDILAQIDAARRQGLTLSVFGVGHGAYNDALLEQLANKGDGAYRFLDSAEEVRRAFVDDLAATLYTIASDVKIQVEWFPAAVVRYRQIGYENRALSVEQFRDDAVDAGEVGSGQAVTALYEIERADSARAAADAPLGVVRVRYRPAAGGAVDEITRPILAADLAPTFQAARPAFRVAACAAAFAERLRRSPHAAGYTFADVADVLRPAVMDFTLDVRMADLLRLIETADRLSK